MWSVAQALFHLLQHAANATLGALLAPSDQDHPEPNAASPSAPPQAQGNSSLFVFAFCFLVPGEAGCSQEEGPKKGFVMGSRTRSVQEILEKCM